MRFQFLSSAESRVPFHCHYSQVHSNLEWWYLLGFHVSIYFCIKIQLATWIFKLISSLINPTRIDMSKPTNQPTTNQPSLYKSVLSWKKIWKPFSIIFKLNFGEHGEQSIARSCFANTGLCTCSSLPAYQTLFWVTFFYFLKWKLSSRVRLEDIITFKEIQHHINGGVQRYFNQ